MKQENQIQMAEELFAEISQWKFPADKFLNNHFRSNRFIGAKDRRAISEHVYGKIRALGNCPEWLEKYLPENFDAEIKALNTDAPTDLRVNPLRAGREALMEELGATPTPRAPHGLRLAKRMALQFDGRYEVQDEGSQLTVLYAEPKPGEKVLDLCAGGGGKTLALAAEMENQGYIGAFDIDDRKIESLKKRAERAGVTIIKTGMQKSEYDLVLVDAPCSGTGTWRRSPDAKWRLTEEKLKSYVNIQRDILVSASRQVKRGGRLVYITCSILPTENEIQIERFLSANGGFKRAKDYMYLSPLKSGTDGFFAAMLVRN